jgi:adenylosuccinate lyase
MKIGWLWVAVAGASIAACSAPKTASRSTDEMLADPAMMQEVLDRCEANKARAASDLECANARRAIAIKVAAEDAAKAAEKQKEFERLRAQRREQEAHQQNAAQDTKPAFDPYSTPVTTDLAGTPPKR